MKYMCISAYALSFTQQVIQASFKRLMKFSCFNLLKGVWKIFLKKGKKNKKKIFKTNTLNSFFITVLKYQVMGKLPPIAAPVRLEAEVLLGGFPN